jgi:hypothetical protein
MSINTYTECTCDRCGETMQMEAAGPLTIIPPSRWMRVETTTSKKDKAGASVIGSHERRVMCPSCAVLVIEVLTPLRRKKRRA